jgi:hypothetical protein
VQLTARISAYYVHVLCAVNCMGWSPAITSDNGKLSEVMAVFRLGTKMTLAFAVADITLQSLEKRLNLA